MVSPRGVVCDTGGKLAAGRDTIHRTREFGIRSVRRHLGKPALSLIAAAALSAGAAAAGGLPPEHPDPAGLELFEKRIRPVLVAQCYECHSADAAASGKLEGGLRLDTRSGIRAGGESGPAIVPGQPDESLLIEALRHESFEMPPNRKLRPEIIADFVKWVELGAPDPRDDQQQAGAPRRGEFQITAADRDFWAFQPIGNPRPPAVEVPSWIRSDLDRFILARIEAEQFRPSPPADKHALLRRATFDLTGLPPTPRQIEEFVQDDSPEAFARVVDRLLASREFGVRWGRHWLDGVRYASDIDQGGFYRDWVVNALNNDLPYDRFVIAQLAGDLLPAESDNPTGVHENGAAIDNVVATGMLALAVWEEVARDLAVAEIVDSQIDVIGQQILGLTLACARCHDHKYDPISAEDYYALAGIFFSTSITDGKLINDGRIKGQPTPLPLLTKADADHNRRIHKQIEAAKKQIERLGAGIASAARLKQLRVELASLQGESDADDAARSRAQAQREKLVEEESKLLADLAKRGWTEQPAEIAEYERLQAEIAALTASLVQPPLAIAVREGGVPGGKRAGIGDAPIYIRGDYRREGPLVPRRFPVILAGENQTPLGERTAASGRLELAQWVASGDNPLTVRVRVNRIWHHLVGQGIVRTPGNFGRLGEPPTHPELLDWLARRFIDSGWSTKALIREIMLSATYQQSAAAAPELLAADPENRLLARMNHKRLEYEAIRDGVLFVTDQLAPGRSAEKGRRARTLYEPVERKQPTDMMAMFDGPDPRVIATERAETTTAPQALFLLNNRFMLDAAARLAQLIQKDARLTDDLARIEHLYLRLFTRKPNAEEIEIGKSFLAGGQWAAYCQLLLCTNEFVYVD
jgi:hypothetical protein